MNMCVLEANNPTEKAVHQCVCGTWEALLTTMVVTAHSENVRVVENLHADI